MDTTTGMFNPYGQPYVVETRVLAGEPFGRIEITWRSDSNVTLTSFPGQIIPPKIWKEVYKVEKIKTVEGYYEAPSDERYIFEE